MRIAAYCRVSTEKEEQLDSLSQQKLFFTEYAVKNNHTLVRLYADEGISGKSIKKREQFLRMLGEARNGLFDMVVVKDISRFARNTVDFLNSIRQLKLMGIGVQFLSNNQTSLGDSEFVLTIFSALAQEESANLSKRVKFGKNVNAQKGKVPNIVFGYDQVDKFTLRINPVEADIVKRIYGMYLNGGLGAAKIAEVLTDSTEVRPKKNGRWSQCAVARILQHEIYTGVVTNKKSEVVDFISGKRREFDRTQWLQYERPELVIISKDDYERAQKLRLDRQDLFKNNKERHSNSYLFSTLIRCEHCGYSYRRLYREFKFTSYRKWTCCGRHLKLCDSRVMIDEKELLGQIAEYFRSIVKDKPAFVRAGLAETAAAQSADCDGEPDLAELEKELARLNAAKQKAIDMFTNDVITMEELKQRTAGLKTQIEKLSERIGEIKDGRAQSEYAQSTEERYLNHVYDNISQIIRDGNMTNEALKQVIEKITVNKNGTVKIQLKNFDIDSIGHGIY
ncbi:serine recombinase [Clostridia bacterium]|nr:serine recombinase [Clostridia bacterium]